MELSYSIQSEQPGVQPLYESPFEMAAKEKGREFLYVNEIGDLTQFPVAPISAILDSMITDSEANNPLSIALNSARLLRGVYDAPWRTHSQHLALYSTCLKAGISTFKNASSSLVNRRAEIIGEFKQDLVDLSLQDFLYTRIEQIADYTSALAYNPPELIAATQRIDAELHGKKVVLIPLANGAVPAGFDIWCRLEQWGSLHPRSEILPLRYSRNKSKDRSLVGPQQIFTYLQSLSSVDVDYFALLEEDSFSGNTMRSAMAQLQELNPAIPIVPFSVTGKFKHNQSSSLF